jgi:putative ABC transport system permease protein
VATTAFEVSGVFRTGNRWLDGSGFVALRQAQAIAARPGLVTLVYVRAEPPGTGLPLGARIREEFPHLTTISNLREFSEVDQGLRVLNSVNLAVIVLAVAGASLGVMNTLARSVFERTHEIGILRAIGWRRRRVFAMVSGEALLLCLLGALIGSLAAIAATELLERASESVSSLVGPRYSASLFARGATMAIVVSLLGASYPAWRAVRLQPIDAIRSE